MGRMVVSLSGMAETGALLWVLWKTTNESKASEKDPDNSKTELKSPNLKWMNLLIWAVYLTDGSAT